ncbi:MAG: hypothetical protein M0Z94_19785, partial [Dehalococcoidales bacterium]|nr:hypothetical protein [Dehalococcoidales bacterium]
MIHPFRAIWNHIYGWLDRRFKLGPILYRLLKDPVPEKGGWFYTLGAAIFLLFIVQIVTGIVLIMYYIPDVNVAR